MNIKIIVSTIFILFFTLKLLAQPWIPRLNKNGTYSLVTENGKMVNNEQYDHISPIWQGTQPALWITKDQYGCIFSNKVSISFEPNRRVSQTLKVKPVIENNKNEKDVLKEYIYLVDFSKYNLFVNIKTGKYITDEVNPEDRYAIRAMPSFPLRNGLLKIHKNGDWVNFVDLNFKEFLPKSIKNGEMVSRDLFIAKDTMTNKFGLIDSAGKIRVPYLFEKMYLSPTRNHIVVGLAFQKDTRYPKYKYGLLDAQGKLVLDTIYAEISDFANTFYIIRKDNDSGVFNSFLEPVIPFGRYKIEQTNDAYLGQGKYLFILNLADQNRPEQNLMVLDSTGNVVLKANGTYFYIHQESKCFTLNSYNGEQSVYSTKYGIQFSFRDSFKSIYCLEGKDDTFLVRNKKEEIELHLRSGKKLRTYPYFALLSLKSIDGTYIAIKEEKYGIIDTSGNIITPLIYDAIYDTPIKGKDQFITGFRTGNTRQYGIYDKKIKKWAIFNTEDEAILYLYPPEFKITVGKSNQYGVIRRNGETVIPDQYQSIKHLKDCPLFACYDRNKQQWSVIGADNRVIFTFDKADVQRVPLLNTLKSTGDYAIVSDSGTLFLEKGTYKKLSYLDLLYIDGICISSYERQGWVTMFKSGIKIQSPKEIWVNYYDGKAYVEE